MQGSLEHVRLLDAFVLSHMATADIDHFESYPQLFSADSHEMLVNVETPGMTMSAIKFHQQEFRDELYKNRSSRKTDSKKGWGVS